MEVDKEKLEDELHEHLILLSKAEAYLNKLNPNEDTPKIVVGTLKQAMDKLIYIREQLILHNKEGNQDPNIQTFFANLDIAMEAYKHLKPATAPR
jgi:hypothetical protein